MAWRMAVVLVLVGGLAAAGGYWFGTRFSELQGTAREAGSAGAGVAAGTATKSRKILYYRNPMGLADTSPTPKKDPMGMDYIPVYEGEEGDAAEAATAGHAGRARISAEKIQKLGVRVEAAGLRQLEGSVRALGRIEADERRIHAIAPKFEGYVERLHVNVTGQAVARGQPLFEVYSPELVSTQREYLIAIQGANAPNGTSDEARRGMRELAEASLMRLRNWDVSDEQLATLARSGEIRRTLTLRSPVAGVVTDKKAVQGMRFMPGEALYQVSDLSSVWVIADVYEQDIGRLRTGSRATVQLTAYPGKVFPGAVTYVYPTLRAETRTLPVRVELTNPGGQLRPGMYAQVELALADSARVLAIPADAVIDSGARRVVLVQVDEGRFEPRDVRLGRRASDYVEVLEGVRAGEPVVVAANFLIDAESRLKAAIGAFGRGSDGGATGTQAGPSGAGRPAAVAHRAEGIVEGVDAASGTVSIHHEPVTSLKWPAMTMEFKPANAALLRQFRSGATVRFEFVERGAGEWVITAVEPVAAAGRAASAGPAGH